MNVVEREEKRISVSGSGDSKTRAFADALSHVQQTVLKETTDVLLRIEPQEIEVISAKKVETVEKFCFFFFPRKRMLYQVELLVKVDMQVIKSESIVFKLQEETQMVGKIPFVSRRIMGRN